MRFSFTELRELVRCFFNILFFPSWSPFIFIWVNQTSCCRGANKQFCFCEIIQCMDWLVYGGPQRYGSKYLISACFFLCRNLLQKRNWCVLFVSWKHKADVTLALYFFNVYQSTTLVCEVASCCPLLPKRGQWTRLERSVTTDSCFYST